MAHIQQHIHYKFEYQKQKACFVNKKLYMTFVKNVNNSDIHAEVYNSKVPNKI